MLMVASRNYTEIRQGIVGTILNMDHKDGAIKILRSIDNGKNSHVKAKLSKFLRVHNR